MTAMCKRYPFIATLMECAASTKHGLFVFPRNGRCGERQFVKPNHVVYWLQQQVSMRYRIKGIPGSSGPESLTGVPLLQGVPSATWHKHPERWALAPAPATPRAQRGFSGSCEPRNLPRARLPANQ